MLSKLLGYLIILGSAIVKVPQIRKILRENSVEGLSLEMFVLEIIGYENDFLRT
jgi:mannose-P-dolichol utilization defect protein 1